jgi:hypothetical protein
MSKWFRQAQPPERVAEPVEAPDINVILGEVEGREKQPA